MGMEDYSEPRTSKLSRDHLYLYILLTYYVLDLLNMTC